MNDWMRRRIERSRARCDKWATEHKTAETREAKKHPDEAAAPRPSQATPLGQALRA